MHVDATELSSQCAELGRILGLDTPVSADVMNAAVRDDAYAHNLLTCRRDPALLDYLLTHPPASPADRRTPSGTELLARGASALARWARAGFTVVGDEELRRRLTACERCPNLGAAEGNRLLYAVGGVDRADEAVCRLCGCPVRRKARLTTEQCPAAHPAKPGHSRWDEPRQRPTPA